MHDHHEINGIRFKADDSEQEAHDKNGCDAVNVILEMDDGPEEGSDSNRSQGAYSRVSNPLKKEPSEENLLKNRGYNHDHKKKGRKKKRGLIRVDHKRRDDWLTEEQTNHIG